MRLTEDQRGHFLLLLAQDALGILRGGESEDPADAYLYALQKEAAEEAENKLRSFTIGSAVEVHSGRFKGLTGNLTRTMLSRYGNGYVGLICPAGQTKGEWVALEQIRAVAL